MTFKPTRRSLAAGLLAAIPIALKSLPASADTDAIFSLIEAHRRAVAAERAATAASNRARNVGDLNFPKLRIERDRRRSERRAAYRALRCATPETAEGYRALSAHYQGLAPTPDPHDVAGRCRADLDAARDRMAVRLAPSAPTVA